MDPASEKAAVGVAEERQSQLFSDLRKRNERRVLVARRAVPGIADDLDTSVPEAFEPPADAAQADLASCSGEAPGVHTLPHD